MNQQQRNNEKPVESAHTAEPLLPRDVGPQHADRREAPEQHRQEAGECRQRAPNRSAIQRRQHRDDPERDENSGRGRRPRQRHGDADRKPIDDAEPARAINTGQHGKAGHAKRHRRSGFDRLA